MRLLHLLLPVLAMTALSAQRIEIWPGTTTATSRGNIGTGDGEVLTGFHESHWKGIGDTGAGASLSGLNYITQDQNASTPEIYEIVVRSGISDAAGPTTGVAGELCVVSGLTTPPSTVLTPAAWNITTAFSAGCRIPTKGHFAVGLRLPANPLWSGDGQSVHVSYMAQQQSGPHQEDHGWQIIGAAAAATHPSSRRTFRVAILTSAPIIQNGVFATTTTTYSRGMGGMFPPIGTHGWSTHVDGGTAFNGGVTGIFMSPVVNNPGLPIPGIRGSVYLGSPLISIATLPLSATGTADLSILDPIGTYSITVHMQAILVDAGFTAIALTNVNSTTFQ